MYRPGNVRHEQPVVFGPSKVPDVSEYRETYTVGVRFRTDPTALAALVPYHFRPVGAGIVTVSSSMFRGIDYLGGRGYNVVRVTTEVIASDRGRELRAPYSLVVWESDSHPVIAGREFQGYAKIVGDIPDHVDDDTGSTFEVSEYGTRLISGSVAELTPLPTEAIEQQNASGESVAVGWKYIPGIDGTPDVDYPTKLISRATTYAAWAGVGTVRFETPTWQQCPFSAQVLATLSELPVLEYGRAFRTRGHVQLIRKAVERLDSI